MKKFLLLLVAISISFASCMTDDGSWKEYQQIAPGIDIYNVNSTHHFYTMQQANAAMRLAMLVSEAKKQGVTDLDKVQIKQNDKVVNVKQRLFGDAPKVAKLENGDYTITYSSALSSQTNVKGVFTIRTHGVEQLEDTRNVKTWTIDTGSNLEFTDSSSGSVVTTAIIGGETNIYSDGEGGFTIVPAGIRFTIGVNKFTAYWSGSFFLKSPVQNLAFSDCLNERFKVNGSAQGQGCFSLNGTSALASKYEVKDGIYIGSRLCSGKVVGTFTGAAGIDYPLNSYPSPFVEVEYVLLDTEGTRYSSTLYYNGYSRKL